MMIDPESFHTANEIRKARAEAGRAFYSVKKKEGATPAIEPEKPGDQANCAGRMAMESLVRDTPISFEWVIQTFTESEIKELAAMPKNLAFSTLTDVLLAQDDCDLSRADVLALNALRAAL